jgi:hypothetical protein
MDDTIGPGDTITIDCGESAGEQEVRDRAGPNKTLLANSLTSTSVRVGAPGRVLIEPLLLVQVDFEAARVFLGQWFGLELATLVRAVSGFSGRFWLFLGNSWPSLRPFLRLLPGRRTAIACRMARQSSTAPASARAPPSLTAR